MSAGPIEARRGHHTSATGIIGGCELPDVSVRSQNSSRLQEQGVFLTAELSLQPPFQLYEGEKAICIL